MHLTHLTVSVYTVCCVDIISVNHVCQCDFLHKVFIQTLVMLPCIVFSIWTVLKRTILKLYITVVL